LVFVPLDIVDALPRKTLERVFLEIDGVVGETVAVAALLLSLLDESLLVALLALLVVG